MPQQLKIASGQGPVAFGGMLDTKEEEEEGALQTTAHSPLTDERHWGVHGEEESEQEEEHDEEDKSLHGSWRPGGLDEALEKAAGPSVVRNNNDVADWRDEAFHGSSPSKSISTTPWQTMGGPSPVTHTAVAESVAISTVEHKPADLPVPFSGDAWAAAMAAGVEEKSVRATETVAEIPAADAVAPTAAKEVEQANSWFSSSSTPWETEGRMASQLAATWDAPPAEAPAVEEVVPHEEPIEEAAAPYQEPAEEFHAPEMASAEEQARLNETQEVPVYKEAEPIWDAPAPVEEAPVVETPALPAPAEVPVYQAAEPIWNAPVPVQEAPVVETPALPARVEAPVATPEAKQADMDALVARVVAKMGPEMLQKVTQEILKPVIEALLKDELNPHKP
jgi:hypothetical protein